MTDIFIPSTTAIGGSVWMSAVTGLVPLIIFFVLLGVFKVKTHWCAIVSLLAALVVAIAGLVVLWWCLRAPGPASNRYDEYRDE